MISKSCNELDESVQAKIVRNIKTINTLIPRSKYGFYRIDEQPKFIVLVSIKTQSGTVVARNAPLAGFINEEDAKSFISQKKEVASDGRLETILIDRECFMNYRYRIISADKYNENMTKYE